MASELNYDDKMASLFNQLIQPYGSPANEEHSIAFIIDGYYSLLAKNKRIPHIDNVVDLVEAANSDIIDEMASLTYDHNGYPADIQDDATHALYNEVYDEIMGDLYDHICDIESYVANTLDDENLPYTFSEFHNMMAFFNNGEIVVANDCQNVLFEKILTEGQKYMEEVYPDIERYKVFSG